MYTEDKQFIRFIWKAVSEYMQKKMDQKEGKGFIISREIVEEIIQEAKDYNEKIVSKE